MTLRIQKGNTANKISNIVHMLSEVDFNTCIQCKKCASGCPVSASEISDSISLPFEIIRRLQLGASTELLGTDIIWICTSCETCYARCPMGIDIASIMDALRILAVENNVHDKKGYVSFFNKAFLKTVKIFGRTYDVAFLTAYKISSISIKKDKDGKFSFLQDMDKLLDIYKKRKIALLPSFNADRGLVKQIFQIAGQRKKRYFDKMMP